MMGLLGRNLIISWGASIHANSRTLNSRSSHVNNMELTVHQSFWSLESYFCDRLKLGPCSFYLEDIPTWKMEEISGRQLLVQFNEVVSSI